MPSVYVKERFSDMVVLSTWINTYMSGFDSHISAFFAKKKSCLGSDSHCMYGYGSHVKSRSGEVR